MKTSEAPSGIPPEIADELQQTLADLVKGVRDREKMNAAAARMDHIREQNRKTLGQEDIGVEIVRQMRDCR